MYAVQNRAVFSFFLKYVQNQTVQTQHGKAFHIMGAAEKMTIHYQCRLHAKHENSTDLDKWFMTMVTETAVKKVTEQALRQQRTTKSKATTKNKND